MRSHGIARRKLVIGLAIVAFPISLVWLLSHWCDAGPAAVASRSRLAAAELAAKHGLDRWRSQVRAVSRYLHGPAQPHLPEAAVAHLSELDRTPEQGQLLWTATEELIAACMRARSFTYLPNPMPEEPEPDPKHARTDPGDVAAARDRGYGLANSIQAGEMPITEADRNAEPLA